MTIGDPPTMSAGTVGDYVEMHAPDDTQGDEQLTLQLLAEEEASLAALRADKALTAEPDDTVAVYAKISTDLVAADFTPEHVAAMVPQVKMKMYNIKAFYKFGESLETFLDRAVQIMKVLL